MQNHNSKPKTNLRERTRQLALRVIKLIRLLPKDLSSQIISKQLLRSCTSIGANVIEARAASSKRDFTNYFTHSLKSANESVFWVELLRDSINVTEIKIDLNPLIQELKEVANILGASILTLKKKNKYF